jgi:Chalcone isomerase-like
MKYRLAALVAALALATSTASQAQTTVQGVKYDKTAQIAGTSVQLLGAGVRYKLVFKVYTAGLYLAGKASTPEEVLAAPGPKRMHIVMLRDIDANELGKLFTKGMEQNAPREEFSKCINGILRMSDIFSAKKKLTSGEYFYVDWVPGVGTQVVVNGQAQGEAIKEPEFFSALMKIWLGKSPADYQLKDALLGKAPTSRDAGN